MSRFLYKNPIYLKHLHKQNRPAENTPFSFASLQTAVNVGYPYRNDKVVTTLAQGCHNLGTRLSQPWHKVATMLFYNLGTTLAQPCILKLSQGCDKVVRTLSQGCPNIVTRLPQCNLVTTLAQPCILKLSQGCDKVVARLPQGCTNIVTRLPQCTLSQPCILKLWQL